MDLDCFIANVHGDAFVNWFFRELFVKKFDLREKDNWRSILVSVLFGRIFFHFPFTFDICMPWEILASNHLEEFHACHLVLLSFFNTNGLI
jgi:hypothetical protein